MSEMNEGGEHLLLHSLLDDERAEESKAIRDDGGEEEEDTRVSDEEECRVGVDREAVEDLTGKKGGIQEDVV